MIVSMHMVDTLDIKSLVKFTVGRLFLFIVNKNKNFRLFFSTLISNKGLRGTLHITRYKEHINRHNSYVDQNGSE